MKGGWLARSKALVSAAQEPVTADEKPLRSKRVGVDQEATVERALAIAAVTNDDPDTLAFYKGRSGSFIDYRLLLRAGEPLSGADKEALGIKTRAIVGEKFVKTLNACGIFDVQVAAGRLASSFNQQSQSVRDLHRTPDVFGAEQRLLFYPSNAAAGPCQSARLLGQSLVNPRTASPLPLTGCEHPDQCACRYLLPK